MRKPIWILLAVLLVICGVGGFAMKGYMAAQAPKKDDGSTTVVQRGDISVDVVDSGTIDAVTSVDVKSQVTGRLKALYKKEGDPVKTGDLIALIDPKETTLQLRQNEAQLSGAESAVQRQSLEIDQRRETARADYNSAKAHVDELELEMKAQPTLTKSAIASAESALQSSLADQQKLVQSVNPTQRTASESAVAEAQANFDNAKSDFQRQTDLEAKGYVSGKILEEAKLAFDLAKVRLDSAKENLDKLDAQLKADESKAAEAVRQAQTDLTRARANAFQDESKRQEYLSAVADLAKAKAALEDPAIFEKQNDENRATVAQLQSVVNDAQRQLGETEIHSPIDGIVTKKGIEVGEMASGLSQFSSGTTIVKIEDRRTMRVKLNINEIDVAKMSLGMATSIAVDALPNDSFSGIVSKIAPASTEDSSTTATTSSTDSVVRYEVEISIDNPNKSLRSGMSAKCTIHVSHVANVLTVPVEFVQKEGNLYYVFTPGAKPTDKPDKHAIKIGATSGTAYEVTSGVTEGEKLVKPNYTGPGRQGMMQAGGPD